MNRITRKQAIELELAHNLTKTNKTTHSWLKKLYNFFMLLVITGSAISIGCNAGAGSSIPKPMDGVKPVVTQAQIGVEKAADDIDKNAAAIKKATQTVQTKVGSAAKLDKEFTDIQGSINGLNLTALFLRTDVSNQLKAALEANKVQSTYIEQIEKDNAAKNTQITTLKDDLKKEKDKNDGFIHVLLDIITAIAVLGVGYFAVMCFLGGPTTGELVGVAACGLMVIVSAVVNVYYSALALYGGIGLGVAVLGCGIIAGVRLYRTKSDAKIKTAWITDLVQVIEGMKQDMAEKSPELIEQWFGRGSKLNGWLHNNLPKELQNHIWDLRYSGEIDLAQPKSGNIDLPSN